VKVGTVGGGQGDDGMMWNWHDDDYDDDYYYYYYLSFPAVERIHLTDFSASYCNCHHHWHYYCYWDDDDYDDCLAMGDDGCCCCVVKRTVEDMLGLEERIVVALMLKGRLQQRTRRRVRMNWDESLALHLTNNEMKQMMGNKGKDIDGVNRKLSFFPCTIEN
jgi:hypothetical protein